MACGRRSAQAWRFSRGSRCTCGLALQLWLEWAASLSLGACWIDRAGTASGMSRTAQYEVLERGVVGKGEQVLVGRLRKAQEVSASRIE